MRFLKRIKIFQCILAFSLDDRYVEVLQLQIIADRPFNLREASFINKNMIVTVGFRSLSVGCGILSVGCRIFTARRIEIEMNVFFTSINIPTVNDPCAITCI